MAITSWTVDTPLGGAIAGYCATSDYLRATHRIAKQKIQLDDLFKSEDLDQWRKTKTTVGSMYAQNKYPFALGAAGAVVCHPWQFVRFARWFDTVSYWAKQQNQKNAEYGGKLERLLREPVGSSKLLDRYDNRK